MKHLYILFVLLSIVCVPTLAQDTAPVPNLNGMSVPQAAAILNIVGLNLGNQLAVDLQPGQEMNTIVGQSLEAGSVVPRGTAIDVSVVLPPNMRLIYDDNDITLQNLTNGNMNLAGLVFRSSGDGAASYNPAQIAGVLDPDDCVQIWSIARNQPKDVAGCDSYLWRSTRDTKVHFWTQLNNIQSFSVIDNGVERMLCDAAPANSQDSPLTCDAYVSGAGNASSGDIAEFFYLIYNVNVIAFVNPTQNQWMITNNISLLNYNPNASVQGASIIFGDPNLLQEQHRIGLGDISRLAPQQCLMFTASDATVNGSPESCFAIAQRPLDGNLAFWRANFVVQNSAGDSSLTCPAATSEEFILCIGSQ